MQATEVYAYLSKLLGTPVAADTLIALTSGQRARLLGWLQTTGVKRADLQGVPRNSCRAVDIIQALGSSDGGLSPGREAPTPGHRREGLAGGLQIGGIGIDLQRVAEIIPYEDSFDFRSSGELTGIFSAREIAYACARPSPTQTLAGLFAAKEAILKASAETAARELKDIEILPDANGAPAHPGFRISISHSGEYATAVALRVEAAVPQPQVPVTSQSTPPEAAVAPVPARSGRTAWIWVLALFVTVLTVYAWVRS